MNQLVSSVNPTEASRPSFCAHLHVPHDTHTRCTVGALLVAIFASILLAVATLVPAPAFAAETGAEGDEGSAAAVVASMASDASVTGSFDKQSYASGDQATVVFRALNESANAWIDAHLEVQIPAGMKLADESAARSISVGRVEPGQAVDLTLSLIVDKVAGGSGDSGAGTGSGSGTALVLTGDKVPPFAVAVIVVVVGSFVVLALASFSHHRNRRGKARGGMSIFLAVVLAVGMAPMIPARAFGEEAGVSLAFSAQGSATCAAASLAVPAQLNVASFEVIDDISVAEVVTVDGQGVSADAQYAQCELVSTLPFVADLSLENLSLGGSFEGLTVVSVVLTGETAVSVRVEGDPGAAGGDGLIVFDRGSFVDPLATAAAVIAVEVPEITFDVEQGSYESSTETFSLPLKVVNGRFAGDAAAEDFIFSSQDLKAVGFTVDAGDAHNGLLKIQVLQGTQREQFDTLSTVIDSVDEDELVFDASLLVGDPAIEHATDMVEGPASSLASAIYATPVGAIEVTDMQYAADGSAVVQGRVTLNVEDGSLQLASLDQISFPLLSEDPEQNTGLLENSAVELGELYSDGFSFSFPLDGETVKGWKALYEAPSVDETSEIATENLSGSLDAPVEVVGEEPAVSPDEVEREFRDDIGVYMATSRVGLADGVVLNAYGIAQQSHVAPLVQGSGEQLNLMGNPTDDAKTAFEVLQNLANAISGFAQNKVEKASGVGSLFGLIASFLTTTPEYSMADLFNELRAIEGQLSIMQTEIQAIATQLQNVEQRAGFVANWAEVKHRMTMLEGYGGLYTTLMAKLDLDDPADTVADLSPANQATLDEFVKSVEEQDRMLSTSTLSETMLMGDLIEGLGEDTVREYYTWLDSYYNWDPETFTSKQLYINSLFISYIYGYGTSMAYLNTKDVRSGGGNNIYKQSITRLKAQADKVMGKLVGVVKVDGSGTPHLEKKSQYRIEAEHRSDKMVRNLLTKTLYDPQTFLNKHTFNGVKVDAFGRSVDQGDIHLYNNVGTINLAQWQQMAKNLGQVRSVFGFKKANTLYDELMILGFSSCSYGTLGNPQESGTFADSGSAWRGWFWREYPSSTVAVGSAVYHKTRDSYAIEHEREVTIDTFDLKTHAQVKNKLLSWHREVYRGVPAVWGYKHKMWPVRVV